MNQSPGSIEVLAGRLDELEKRVCALEHAAEVHLPEPNPAVMPMPNFRASQDSELQTANVFPVIGRALLGIAGAYLLRALAEAGLVPRIAVAAVAILYAFTWLIWAGSSAKNSRFVSIVYTGTSSAILAPMLWEITLHFHVFTSMVTAGILTAFVTLATVVDLRIRFSGAWIAQSVAAILAVVLAVATHQISPFWFVLLVVMFVIEFAKTLDYAQPAWPLIALATDAASWGSIFIYSGPQNSRAEYPELSTMSLVLPAFLLFAINATGVSVRALMQQKVITLFEIIQVMIGFGLATCSVFLFAPRAVPALGVACLITAVAGYYVAFRYLRLHALARNFRVLSAWSAALLIAGATWALPGFVASIVLALTGVAGYIVAARLDSTIPAGHGALYLCAAVILADAPRSVLDALVSSHAAMPSLVVGIMACCAVTAYIVDKDVRDGGWTMQTLHLVPAFIAASTIAALFIQGSLAVTSFVAPLNPHRTAFLRTLVISAMALILAYVGSRWNRVAMTRLAYLALVFIAAKLLFEDLRHGHMEFIAASIFLFALTLIAVPRLVRSGAASHSSSGVKTAVHAGR